MLKRKRPKFVPGEILEVPLRSGRYGYCQVQLKDFWGPLINIFDPAFDSPQDPTKWDCEPTIKKKAYVNDAGARADGWKHVCILPLGEKASELPLRFMGGTLNWTIKDAEGNNIIYHLDAYSREELIARGYIPMTIWRAEKIALYIDEDIDMVWEGSW